MIKVKLKSKRVLKRMQYVRWGMHADELHAQVGGGWLPLVEIDMIQGYHIKDSYVLHKRFIGKVKRYP